MNNIFSTLYRTRIKVTKDSTTIINLSLLFTIVSALLAIWLVVIGAVVALLLGYRFSIQKNAPEFTGDLKEIVEDAGENVKEVVRNFTGKEE
jgi:heme/copper-type cytochrome/quinol oxidase subunit 2